MQRYIVVRLVQGIVTLLVLGLAVFLSVHLTGDPALYLLGPEGTQADYEQLKKNLGLDKPLPVQYALFLGIDHFILPAFVLSSGGMAGIVRLVRSSMLEVLDSEYVKFARVKGLSENMVIYKHALKNAVIPALTFGGLTLAGLLNGSVAIEVVFAWPGIGRLMLQGINQRDFPIIQATVLAAGFFYIAISLIVDILYAYVNPRIRYE
jgi:ABC-type dipeptide/oligopeptide/nickel transport system permease component